MAITIRKTTFWNTTGFTLLLIPCVLVAAINFFIYGALSVYGTFIDYYNNFWFGNPDAMKIFIADLEEYTNEPK